MSSPTSFPPPPPIQNTKPLPNISLSASIRRSQSQFQSPRVRPFPGTTSFRPTSHNAASRPTHATTSDHFQYAASTKSLPNSTRTRAIPHVPFNPRSRPSQLHRSLLRSRTNPPPHRPTKATLRPLHQPTRANPVSTPLLTRPNPNATHPTLSRLRIPRSFPKPPSAYFSRSTNAVAHTSLPIQKPSKRQPRASRPKPQSNPNSTNTPPRLKKKKRRRPLTPAQCERLWNQLWASRLRAYRRYIYEHSSYLVRRRERGAAMAGGSRSGGATARDNEDIDTKGESGGWDEPLEDDEYFFSKYGIAMPKPSAPASPIRDHGHDRDLLLPSSALETPFAREDQMEFGAQMEMEVGRCAMDVHMDVDEDRNIFPPPVLDPSSTPSLPTSTTLHTTSTSSVPPPTAPSSFSSTNPVPAPFPPTLHPSAPSTGSISTPHTPQPDPDLTPFFPAPIARELMAFFGSPRFGPPRAGALLTTPAAHALEVVRAAMGRDSAWLSSLIEAGRFGKIGSGARVGDFEERAQAREGESQGVAWAKGTLRTLRAREEAEGGWEGGTGLQGKEPGEHGLWDGMEYVSREVGMVWVGHQHHATPSRPSPSAAAVQDVERGDEGDEEESSSTGSSGEDNEEEVDDQGEGAVEVAEEMGELQQLREGDSPEDWTVGESDLESDWEAQLDELDSGDEGGDVMIDVDS